MYIYIYIFIYTTCMYTYIYICADKRFNCFSHAQPREKLLPGATAKLRTAHVHLVSSRPCGNHLQTLDKI